MWRLNSEGTYVRVGEDGRPTSAPANAPPPPTRGAVTVTNSVPPPAPISAAPPARPAPAPQAPRAEGQNFGAILAQSLANNTATAPSLRVTNTGGITLADSRPPPSNMPAPTNGQAPGSVIGEQVGAYEPLDFGEVEMSPAYQQAEETIRGLIEDAGEGVELPAAPTFTEDPANARLVTAAQDRRNRINPRIEALIAQREEQLWERDSLPGWRRNLGDFGKWLGRVAGTHDLSQAGNVLYDMRSERADRESGWLQDIVRMTEAGASLEDAIAQAEAGQLSDRHSAGERTSVAGYERGVSQAGLRARSQDAQQRLSLALAQLVQEGQTQAEASRDAALGALGSTPEYGAAAAGEMGNRAFPNSPRASQALGSSLANEARLQRLARQVTGPYSRRQDLRELGRQLRRLDPNITDQDIQRIALMLSSAPAE